VAEKRAYPAYLAEREGGWEPVSWSYAGTRVEALANGLLALGIEKGEAVALLGKTRMEWALADFALALVGAVSAPVLAARAGVSATVRKPVSRMCRSSTSPIAATSEGT